MIFLTSPGNPTSTLVPLLAVQQLLESPSFKGLVVIDEAYIDFSILANPNEPVSAASLLPRYPNLVVLQTLSKGFGLAAIRLGVALASSELVQILSNTKAPYNISSPTAALALHALSAPSIAIMQEKVHTLLRGREWVVDQLQSRFGSKGSQDIGERVGGLDGNFVLFPILNKATGKPDNVRSETVYQTLAEKEGVVVRFRGRELGCEGCVRVTIGTEAENRTLLDKLKIVLESVP